MKYEQRYHAIVSSQLFRFLVIGLGINGILVASFHYILSQYSIEEEVLGAAFSILGICISYLLNAKFVFAKGVLSVVDFLKFFASYSLSPIIHVVIIAIGTASGVHATICFVFGIGVTTLTNFMLVKFLVFKN